MGTDLRLVRLPGMHVSARTLDCALELGSQVRVLPRGNSWTAIATHTAAEPLAWMNTLGFVAIDGFGFADLFADGLNEAGRRSGRCGWRRLSCHRSRPPREGRRLRRSRRLASRHLQHSGRRQGGARHGAGVGSEGERPVAGRLADAPRRAGDGRLRVHRAPRGHDAHGGDLVVEFTADGMQLHDNPIGVLTNSPTFDWHLTNLRNYVGLTNVNDTPVNLMGMPVTPTGNGSGLLGMPGDVTPPSRFVRATVPSEIVLSATDARDAVNQAFHSLDLVAVPRFVAASGDYTRWRVVRDHDSRNLYVRSYDGWTTDAHDLAALGVSGTGPVTTLAFPSAP